MDNYEIARHLKEDLEIFGPTWRSSFAFDIKRAMISKGLKNTDIAERLDVSEANISRMLRGDQNIKLETMYMLAASVGEALNTCVGERYKDQHEYDEVVEGIEFGEVSAEINKHIKKMRGVAMLPSRNEDTYMEVANEGAIAFG